MYDCFGAGKRLNHILSYNPLCEQTNFYISECLSKEKLVLRELVYNFSREVQKFHGRLYGFFIGVHFCIGEIEKYE